LQNKGLILFNSIAKHKSSKAWEPSRKVEKMDKKIVESAAAAAAKVLYAELVSCGEEKTFRARLDFEVDMKRGESFVKTNPQKARPWSLVQVLISKLNATVGESVVESWLEEGIKEAQLLNSVEEASTKKRISSAIEKILPEIQEERKGNIYITKKAGRVVEIPEGSDKDLLNKIDFPVSLVS